MFDEIEKFLRQAAEAAAQQQAKQAAEQRQRSAPQAQQPRGQRPVEKRPQSQRTVPDLEIVDAEMADTVSPNQRLARDFRSSSAIAEHTRHLGEQVGLADENLEAHLHAVFDHKLGSLRNRGGSSATDEAATIAAGPTYELTAAIGLLISSRSNMRAAMLLGEVLRRPEERW